MQCGRGQRGKHEGNYMDLIKYTPSGAIAVRQSSVNGYELSFNPDDERWYVHGANGETLATFIGDRKGFHNARQYARTH